MEEKKKSGLATAGMVLGIVGICTSFIPFINNLSLVMAIIAFIFGIIALVKKAGIGKAVATIILAVFTVIITLSMQNSFSNSLDKTNKELDKAVGNSTEEILKNDANVVLNKFEVIKDKYGYEDTELKVSVTNKTSDKKSFNIHIEAVDNTGARIGDDYVYANDLGAGQTQEFKIFTYVSSDKVEIMKNATFKIVEVSMY